MFSAKKGFLLTDALVSVFIVFLLCAIVSAVMTSQLKSEEAAERAAARIEEEAKDTFVKGESSCRICTLKPEEEFTETEEGDSFSSAP